MIKRVMLILSTKLGTALGTGLAGYGVATADIETLVAAFLIIVGMITDVITSTKMEKKR